MLWDRQLSSLGAVYADCAFLPPAFTQYIQRRGFNPASSLAWRQTLRYRQGGYYLSVRQVASRHHFSDTAFNTPSSCTSVHSLSGLYSFIPPAIREVFSPRLR